MPKTAMLPDYLAQFLPAGSQVSCGRCKEVQHGNFDSWNRHFLWRIQHNLLSQNPAQLPDTHELYGEHRNQPPFSITHAEDTQLTNTLLALERKIEALIQQLRRDSLLEIAASISPELRDVCEHALYVADRYPGETMHVSRFSDLIETIFEHRMQQEKIVRDEFRMTIAENLTMHCVRIAEQAVTIEPDKIEKILRRASDTAEASDNGGAVPLTSSEHLVVLLVDRITRRYGEELLVRHHELSRIAERELALLIRENYATIALPDSQHAASAQEIALKMLDANRVHFDVMRTHGGIERKQADARVNFQQKCGTTTEVCSTAGHGERLAEVHNQHLIGLEIIIAMELLAGNKERAFALMSQGWRFQGHMHPEGHFNDPKSFLNVVRKHLTNRGGFVEEYSPANTEARIGRELEIVMEARVKNDVLHPGSTIQNRWGVGLDLSAYQTDQGFVTPVSDCHAVVSAHENGAQPEGWQFFDPRNKQRRDGSPARIYREDYLIEMENHPERYAIIWDFQSDAGILDANGLPIHLHGSFMGASRAAMNQFLCNDVNATRHEAGADSVCNALGIVARIEGVVCLEASGEKREIALGDHGEKFLFNHRSIFSYDMSRFESEWIFENPDLVKVEIGGYTYYIQITWLINTTDFRTERNMNVLGKTPKDFRLS